jgi:peptidoglycan hydrolase-like protein with peptidoglycan-binding domain
MQRIRVLGATGAALLSVVVAAAALPVPAAAAPRPVVAQVPSSEPWTRPVHPPLCTEADYASLELSGCAVDLGGTSADRGFGVPPFPAVTGTPTVVDPNATPVVTDPALATASSTPTTTFPPEGWKWLGWSYNGSPVLASWEAMLVRNTTKIGPVGAGRLVAHPAALPLFEGFLREVTAAGFRFSSYGIYTFRCMSTTRRDCKGMTPANLSNHAYGLALDVDPAKNPEQNVRDGADPTTGQYVSACGAAMKTSIPEWVVRSAQRWGLYWLGYPSRHRCRTASSPSSSSYRDPMHFEFRGTPDLAARLLARNLVTPAPVMAAPAAPATPEPSAPVDLAKGARSTAVADLQKALTAAGFPVSSTGYFGTMTEAAVRAFQAARGLPVTGVADLTTQQALQGATLAGPPATTPPPAATPAVWTTLGLGARGAGVVAVQQALSSAGYRVSATGYYGTITTGLVKAFQTAKGLPVTGTVDAPTATALGVAGTPAPPAPAPATTPPPSTAAPAPPALPMAASAWTTLAAGTRSPVVAALQQALTTAGHPVSATGYFGTLTAGAVTAFQGAKGLPVTGKADLATAQALGLASTAPPWTTLGYGARGDAVTVLQQALTKAGHRVSATGFYGTVTTASVKALQAAKQLPVTGRADVTTADALGLIGARFSR